ncbi:MAG TPA: FAD-dependent oxidoreductase [Gaiellaceae bacterium]
MSDLDVCVVGAGPFGLSIAASLPDRRVKVFGSPMQTWRTHMPADMLLRSAWDETSLRGPEGAGSIDEWAAAAKVERTEPLPLSLFLAYADWFRERYVGDHDESEVTTVVREADRFSVTTAGGQRLTADAVVVAVGVTPFPSAPEAFRPHLGRRVRFAIESQRAFHDVAGKRMVVVGAGQAGLETAGLAAAAGADVEVIARSGVRWFADREPHHRRGALGARIYRLAYPAIGYGPPPINRLVLHPDLFAALPVTHRRRLTRRLLRPGGSPWVRELVEGNVKLTEGRQVAAVARSNGGLQLMLDDGSARVVDSVMLATGYRFDAGRLAFLDESIRRRIVLEDGYPKLDRSFESAVPGLFFVGYPAEGRFGPISRFVLGTRFTAQRLRERLG